MRQRDYGLWSLKISFPVLTVWPEATSFACLSLHIFLCQLWVRSLKVQPNVQVKQTEACVAFGPAHILCERGHLSGVPYTSKETRVTMHTSRVNSPWPFHPA